tara:strand:- start:89 stop:385 length:297 start_codon:yes stop_codon:yes gene_type:complete
MKLKVIKGSNAICRRYRNCERYVQTSTSYAVKIPRGEHVLEKEDGKFICRYCAIKFVNERFNQLIAVSKQIVDEGYAELGEDLVFNLEGGTLLEKTND